MPEHCFRTRPAKMEEPLLAIGRGFGVGEGGIVCVLLLLAVSLWSSGAIGTTTSITSFSETWYRLAALCSLLSKIDDSSCSSFLFPFVDGWIRSWRRARLMLFAEIKNHPKGFRRVGWIFQLCFAAARIFTKNAFRTAVIALLLRFCTQDDQIYDPRLHIMDQWLLPNSHDEGNWERGDLTSVKDARGVAKVY